MRIGVLRASIGALILAANSNAYAIDKTLELEPPPSRSGPGYGYDSINRSFLGTSCVVFNPALSDGGNGGTTAPMNFKSVTSTDDITQSMDLGLGVKFQVSLGVAGASTNDKMSFLQKSKTTRMTHTIVASYEELGPPQFIQGDINLTPAMLALLTTNPAAFRQKCGDYLIYGNQSGRWYYGTAELLAQEDSTENKLAVTSQTEAKYGPVSGALSVDSITAAAHDSSTTNLTLNVNSSGGAGSMPSNIDEFTAQAKDFPNKTSAPRSVYKLVAVPYHDIIANWPVADPFAQVTALDKLNTLASAAFAMQSLIDDTNFLLRHSDLFALGSPGSAIRNARLTYVKQRLTAYERGLNELKGVAQHCDADWGPFNGACEGLYNKWSDWEDWENQEYTQFPVRYTTDCYAPRDVSGVVGDKINGVLGVSMGTFQHRRGDKEMGGGPVNFIATLRFATDGDARTSRSMLAPIFIYMEENGADHTTFDYNNSPNVLNLDDPSIGQLGNFAQCSFNGTGVKNQTMSYDSTPCDVTKRWAPPSVYNACYAQLQATPQIDYGRVKTRTLKDTFGPQRVANPPGTGGIMQAISCTFDRDHNSDDGAVIGCFGGPNGGKPAEFVAMQLDLVNARDAEANAWTPPPQGFDPTIPRPARANTSHAGSGGGQANRPGVGNGGPGGGLAGPTVMNGTFSGFGVKLAPAHVAAVKQGLTRRPLRTFTPPRSCKPGFAVYGRYCLPTKKR